MSDPDRDAMPLAVWIKILLAALLAYLVVCMIWGKPYAGHP